MSDAQIRRRATREGVVVSSKMDKTVVVSVNRTYRHEVFGKYVRSKKKYYAHDEANVCQKGDVVIISETRPTSKLKRWKVEKVVRHGLRHTVEEQIS